MRISTGKPLVSILNRSAIRTCGTKQTSANVGISPWEKTPLLPSFTNASYSAKLSSIQCSIQLRC